MRGNTYQNFRRMFIEGCLRNTMRDYTKEEILRELNEAIEKDYCGKSISERTFEIDLKFIKDELELAGFQLNAWKVGKQCFYRYSNPEFSIFSDVKKHEIERLLQAVQMLKQIKGIDLNDELLEVLLKLDTQVKYGRTTKKNVIDLQQVVASIGYEHVDDLYDAIVEETAVELLYQPFNKEARSIVVHPYYLKQYNCRWFLFGFDESRNDISTFPLDRIQKIKPVSKIYILPDDIFNPDEYFKHIIGVTRYKDRPVEDIVLQFSSNRAPYIATKPLHHSQEVVEEKEDGSILIKLKLIPNPELESLILSFGKDVVVLQPLSLTTEIKSQLKDAIMNCVNC